VLQKLDLLPVETEIIPICESRMCHSEWGFSVNWRTSSASVVF
jgi:hypothetical protein